MPVVRPTPLIATHGPLWARNAANLKELRAIERRSGKLYGVYVLCDGSMPVYIGRGRIRTRLRGHRRSKSRGQFWDHFSWFAVSDRRFEADLEALLLRMLPSYLRILNKQRTKFATHNPVVDKNPVADVIKRPRFVISRRRR
jgi:hypothetical protein